MDITVEREIVFDHTETFSFTDGKITIDIFADVSDEHMSKIIYHINKFKSLSDTIKYIENNTNYDWISQDIDNKRVKITELYIF